MVWQFVIFFDQMKVWNAELASQAVLNVNQCIMNHDPCRSTELFHYAGQNLAMRGSKGSPVDPLATAVPKMIKSWYDEVKDALASDIDNYQSTTRTIGHFTQVVTDRATHVGCGAAYFVDASGWDTILLACNYAITNMIGSPVYAKVTSTDPEVASKCTTGVNPSYSALCSVNEVFVLPKRF